MMNRSKLKKAFPVLLFCVYIGFVLWITVINRKTGIRRSMLTPFWEFANVLKNTQRWYYVQQIIGNILLLFPFGFLISFLPKFHDITWKKVLLHAFCVSLLIEITQYLTCRGMLEFDDLFNNTLGGLLGYKVYELLYKTPKEPDEPDEPNEPDEPE